tara:strand:- start:300 stop:548 length:249 start_codon:yes stop_codon:yes gene_type:complete
MINNNDMNMDEIDRLQQELEDWSDLPNSIKRLERTISTGINPQHTHARLTRKHRANLVHKLEVAKAKLIVLEARYGKSPNSY